VQSPADPFCAAGETTNPPDGALVVSIVSHEQAALADALLRQLAAQTRRGLIREVRLTLNLPEHEPSTWHLPIFRGAHGEPAFALRIIRNARPAGFALNHNRALADVHDGVVAVLNPDLQLLEDPLALLTQASQAPGVGLVVPQVLEADGRAADAARELLTPGSVLSRQLLRRRHASDRPAWYAGMCLVLPGAAWHAVGGFDARYRMYCEDFDLCARLRLAGYALRQVPEARVLHPARRASHRALRPLAWHLGSLARVWRSPTYHAYRRLLRAEAQSQHASRPGG